MNKFYIYICESSKDFGSEVRLYQYEENAKKAVKFTYQEYVENQTYKPNDNNSFTDAKQDYLNRNKTGFTITLYDNEQFECHYEEAQFSDWKN